ncbi:hypothetical protein GGR57DRAFT_458354 [Xylariaceae sp. FL1272]|nr:hypothetical protein GGR57DRAFT_458354 [Xylariaceae sp. FL1272]
MRVELDKRLIISDPNATALPVITTDVVPLADGGNQIVILVVFLVFITTLWTVMRIWSRRLMRVSLAADDYCHVVSLIFFYGLSAASILSAVIGGAGHHVATLQEWHIVRYSAVIFSIEFLYALSVGFVKISVALMIMRIFPARHVRIGGITLIVLSALWMLHPLFTGLLLCTPIEANWNPTTPGAECGNQYIGYGVVAGIDILNELALLILPIPSLLGIHLNTRYKVALLGVFGTGLITLIVTIIRIPVLLTTNFVDLTYDTRNQLIVLGEPAAALVVSCSPVLRPVFDKAFTRITGRTRTVTGGTSGSSGFRSAGSRSNIKKSRGYTSFGDSTETLELGNVVSPYGDRQTKVIAATRPFDDDLAGSPADRQNAGILVMKETIISTK